MRKVLSFDIDGTLETGEPAGSITMAMVRRAVELGYIIGSCSDKPVSVQKGIWEEHKIQVEFTVLKHMLHEVRARIEADQYQHIGDTVMDRHYAELYGFTFLDVATAFEPWMVLDTSDDPNNFPTDQVAKL